MRLRPLLLIVVALALVPVCPRRASAIGDESTTRQEDIVATISSRWVGCSHGGYYPIRIRLANRGTDRVLTFRFERQHQQVPEVRKTVEVPQNATVQFTLLVPCVSMDTYGVLKTYEAGREIEGFRRSISLPEDGQQGLPRPSLLVISPSQVDCDRFEDAANHIAVTRSMTATTHWGWGYSGGTTSHEVIDPTMLPDEWLAYSGVDLVAISLQTLAGLEAPERAALGKWVQTGGTLIAYEVGNDDAGRSRVAELLGLAPDGGIAGWQPSDAGLRQRITPIDPAAAGMPGYSPGGTGMGEEQVQSAFNAGFAWDQDAFATRDFLLGQVIAFAESPFPGSPHDWHWLLSTIGPERLNWQDRHGISARAPSEKFLEFLIPSVRSVPTVSFLVLITLFSLVIGPVNYFWLWRARRLQLLLLTIPVLAFGTSLALFAYSSIAHGFSTRSRVRSVTVLDQPGRTAVTISRIAMYSGLAPSGGLEFSQDTAVYPIWPPDHEFDSAETDWTEFQRLSSGWLRSRTRTQFLTVAHRDERGRLTVSESTADGMTIENGLEWPLEALIVADEQGRLFFGSEIPAGASATLQPIQPEHRGVIREAVDAYPLEVPAQFDGDTIEFGMTARYFGGWQPVEADYSKSVAEQALAQLKSDTPPAGTYWALLGDEAPVDLGMERTRAEAGLHVLIGYHQ
ncbi:hypothetical protein Mal4_07190 [Maioricimonas rarisocia]|uniref:Uncharacterized protein n=1 Tax=Maioricimonas rarisocia TaxID=2528026 RepID=A0A517Z1T8_9PLAN|nr:hypothetical protein [Maioricimonas rarisocia]QDU36433.1 hypothetical protein Mal4_07190 [Maioricimonas rarisocia]